MSLRPDDRSSRNRDRSSTRRDRSRSNVRTISPPRDYDNYDDNRSQLPGSFQEPSSYEIRAPDSKRAVAPYPDDDFDTLPRRRNTRDDDDHYQRPKHETRDSYSSARQKRHDDSDSDRSSALAYGQRPRQVSYQEITPADSDRYRNERHGSQSYKVGGYASQEPYKYAEVSDKIKYTSKPAYDDRRDDRRDRYEDQRLVEVRPDDRRDDRRERYDDTRIMEVRPDDRKHSTSEVHRTSISRTTSNSLAPAGLGARMDRLSVSGGRPDMHAITGGGRPPASPLLEAYHGTYQSISPMPMAIRMDDDMDDIPSLEYVQPKKAEKKKVKLYDPEADAKALAKALNASSPNTEVICEILPPLTDDQIWELRKEYKKQYKVQGKGINLSKHLKMKLTGNFGKIVYVTALGRWESEGYWANFFYQSHASRRELLIESLMGRPNADIRSIKEEFKDKRYNDDLVRCMEKELKMDKFRTAILMALEGRRQEEQDVYPHEYRAKDVEVLQRSVRAREGGESAMLEIVVRRSDAHLRECLRLYESMYGENFARSALKKSNNLVGEVIAHILNGVINKPARDAILLRHAIKDIANHNKDDELRYELLTSRLVRLHWDRLHMMRVKKEYKDKYGKYLEEDLEDSTKGDFREFVVELCNVQGPK